MNKIWHKPLHCRKVWKDLSLQNKTLYYLEPFVKHLMDTWWQPLPFPTLFKIIYSCVLFALMLLPLLIPIIIVISYYVIIQILVESSLHVIYPRKLDVYHYLVALFKFRIENEKHIEFLNLYMERWRYIVTAIASCIDYLRLALTIVTN